MTNNSDDRAARQRALNAGGSKSRPHAKSARRSSQPGDWQRQYDHYQNLARQTGDMDRVTRESHWQHAEHFFRMMKGPDRA
jgi:hypothetical protein